MGAGRSVLIGEEKRNGNRTFFVSVHAVRRRCTVHPTRSRTRLLLLLLLHLLLLLKLLLLLLLLSELLSLRKRLLTAHPASHPSHPTLEPLRLSVSHRLHLRHVHPPSSSCRRHRRHLSGVHALRHRSLHRRVHPSSTASLRLRLHERHGHHLGHLLRRRHRGGVEAHDSSHEKSLVIGREGRPGLLDVARGETLLEKREVSG